MKPEDMQLAIAKEMGWREYISTPESIRSGRSPVNHWIEPKPNFPSDGNDMPPNYPEDMSACLPLIKHLENKGYSGVFVVEDGMTRCTFINQATKHEKSSLSASMSRACCASFLRILNLYI